MSSQIPQELQTIIADCASAFNSGDSSSMNKCFTELNKLDCNHIHDIIKSYAGNLNSAGTIAKKSTIMGLSSLATSFNSTEAIVENVVNSLGDSVSKIYCLLDEINKQLLDGSSVKFNLPEFRKIEDKLIVSLGGYTKGTINLFFIIIGILAIIILFLIFTR